MSQRVLRCRLGFAGTFAILLLPQILRADCPKITFEDRAVGTTITTQYDGVTFSVQPQSCGGSPTLYLRIVNPTGGTSSGTRALQIDTGCPDFSPDYLRMVFDQTTREVTFTVGEATGAPGYDFDVRYYSDAGLLGTLHVDSADGVTRLVHIGSPSSPQIIRRVEVDSPIDAFEVIDDLAFQNDATPPQAEIATPIYEACACGTIQVTGIACDPDGEYGSDKLEYRAVTADPDDPWTLIGTATVPLCDTGGLYNWNTSGLPHGKYFLRLTVTNACGLSNTAVVVVYADRQFDTLTLRSPKSGGVVGGKVCLDGTVWDHLCFDQYEAEYRTLPIGAWMPVDAAHPSYDDMVANDPAAEWNTAALADGDYQLRITAVDDCDNDASTTADVEVDNTAPTTSISEPMPCAHVSGVVPIRGTINDAHLSGWQLYYTGGTTHGWQLLASGTTAKNNAVLYNWDTDVLPRCAYALRLVATDKAVLACNSSLHNQSEYAVVVLVRSSVPGDVNCDGEVDNFDIAAFVTALVHPDDYPLVYPDCAP